MHDHPHAMKMHQLSQSVRFCEMLEVKLPGPTHRFGAKLDIGVDSQSGLAHSAVLTPANVHDKHPLPQLLYGQERQVYSDSAYASQKALIHSKAPKARLHESAHPPRGASR